MLVPGQWCGFFTNSGIAAIALAIGAGAQRVILLGYDCQFGPDGRRHWFGDHPKGFTNCASIKKWPAQFERVNKDARRAGCEIVNASRATALRCFPRMALADVLCSQAEAA